MLSYSNFPIIKYASDTLPYGQQHSCERTDIYVFERMRLGKQMVTSTGEKFGPFLYRNCRNNVLISSWDKPIDGKSTYTSSDVGIYSDARIYYKNN